MTTPKEEPTYNKITRQDLDDLRRFYVSLCELIQRTEQVLMKADFSNLNKGIKGAIANLPEHRAIISDVFSDTDLTLEEIRKDRHGKPAYREAMKSMGEELDISEHDLEKMVEAYRSCVSVLERAKERMDKAINGSKIPRIEP